jgi:hypothetical protein
VPQGVEVQVLSHPPGRLAQLARASRLHREGRGFESLSAHQTNCCYNLYMTRRFLWGVIFLTVFSITFFAAPSFAAKVQSAGRSPVKLGNDISWPQCNKALPKGQSFGIVGVNDGLANNTNPCFSQELSWAYNSSGGTGQPTAALYVNTANPGHQSALWPKDNSYNGTPIANPYGTCGGAEDAACAYMYGYERAYDDANIRGVAFPGTYLWWLDIETVNSWSATNLYANQADIQGMADYIGSIGTHAGLYSTSYQWNQIVGTSNPGGSLNGLNSWLPGARSQKSAVSNCSLPSLTAGGEVTLTQYTSNGYDYDYSCI